MTGEQYSRLVEPLIQTAYEAVYSPDQWLDLLRGFIAATGADAGALYAPASAGGTVHPFLTVNYDLDVIAHLTPTYGRQAPFLERATAAGLTPGVFHNFEVIPQDELHRMDFYQAYMRPLNVEHGLQSIYRLADTDGARPIAMSLTRSAEKPAFGEAEKRLAMALFPHVRRAISLVLDVQVIRMIDPALESALDGFDTACCLLGPHGKILFANAAATRLLGRDVGLFLREGRLMARSGATDGELQTAVQRACGALDGQDRSGSEVILRGPGASAPVVAVVAPLGHDNPFKSVGPIRAAIYLVDGSSRALAGSDLARLRNLFGLTEAESAIATRLIEGQSVKQIAQARGTTEQTVRTQIKLILEKTQSTRQADLLRLQRLFSVGPTGREADTAAPARPRKP